MNERDLNNSAWHDMKLLGLHPELAIFKDMWRDLIWGKRLTLA